MADYEPDPFMDFLDVRGREPPLTDAEKQALRDRLAFSMDLNVAADHAACTGDEKWILAADALSSVRSISDDPKAALLDFVGARPNSLRAHIRTRAKVIELQKQRAGSPQTADDRPRAIIPPAFWDHWDSGEEDGFTDDSWNISVFFAQARADDLSISLRCIGVEFCEQDIRALFDLPDSETVTASVWDIPKRGAPASLKRMALTIAAVLRAERKGEFRIGHDRTDNLANVLRAYGANYSEAYLNSLFIELAPLLAKAERSEK